MTDLIDRQEAIRAFDDAGFCSHDYIVGTLKDLPSAQPEPHWIPCSERLPDEDSDILVTYAEKDEKRIVPVNYGRVTWFDCVFNMALNPVGVLAWMPLPKPYGGEGDE